MKYKEVRLIFKSIMRIGYMLYKSKICKILGNFLLKNMIAFGIPIAFIIYVLYSLNSGESGASGEGSAFIVIFLSPMFIFSFIYFIWSIFKLYRCFEITFKTRSGGNRVFNVIVLIFLLIISIIIINI